jgi:hypothetical protein
VSKNKPFLTKLPNIIPRTKKKWSGRQKENEESLAFPKPRGKHFKKMQVSKVST